MDGVIEASATLRLALVFRGLTNYRPHRLSLIWPDVLVSIALVKTDCVFSDSRRATFIVCDTRLLPRLKHSALDLVGGPGEVVSIRCSHREVFSGA